MTRPRLAILEAITDLPPGFSIHDVEQWLIQHRIPMGIASIFRTVRMLCEIGVLRRVHGYDDCHRYTLSDVVCTQCGAIEPFEDAQFQAIISSVEQATGYRIQEPLIELLGLCPTCLASGQ